MNTSFRPWPPARSSHSTAASGWPADRTDIAALKAAVDLIDIVGRHVTLARKGSGRPEHWGRCPFHADGTPSFKVDPERQEFHCFGCGAHGDALDFLERVERLDLTDAIDRLRQLAGEPWVKRRPPLSPTPQERSQVERNGELAQEIWRQSERIRDRLALDYLVCRRGITDWDEDRVRWHPACPWGRDRVGCIVAPVVSHRTGYTVGIWRIWPSLTEPMKGRRMGLGPAKGNCSPIWWPEGDELAIAEGVEDSLAVHQREHLPCWAALSAGNMGELSGLPTFIRRVTIFADRDLAGQRGAHALADRLRAEGRQARVLEAQNHKDPNDVLLAGGSQ